MVIMTDINELELRVTRLEQSVNRLNDTVIRHDVKLNIIAYMAGAGTLAAFTTLIGLVMHVI